MSHTSDLSQPSGLTSLEVAEAFKKFGPNELNKKIKRSKLKVFLLQFNNPMVYVLLAAVVLSIFMGEVLNSIAIVFIVILNSLIGFFQELKSESSVNALKDLAAPKGRVKRDGKIMLIASAQIVPGDVLILEAGDYVVADAKIFTAAQLSADESILTGESVPAEKNSKDIQDVVPLAERENYLHAGTAVSTGSGIAVVTSTGMNTELGKISGLLDKTTKIETPLQIMMNQVSYKLLKLAGVVMILVLIIGISKGHQLLSIIMYAISLAVAAVPEGLATVVTLSLALAVRRMTKRNAILRKLAAVETLGSADVICTDKTGTLTTGKMKARETFTLKWGISESPQPTEIEFYRASILCNNASLDHDGSGDTTEIALLLMAKEHGQNILEINASAKRLKENSFDSERKRMSVLVDEKGLKKIYCKGAPESILSLCKMDKEDLDKTEKAIIELASKGRRLLALSFKSVSSTGSEEENDLEFLGLVSLADPPKEETPAAIKICKAAGVRVIMITGDHPQTAEAIGKELGIIEPGKFEGVMTGEKLDKLGLKELQMESEKIAVYARVTSEHKLKIIEALQKNGHIVGMTGDGVNDAPALKKASIGISMGRGGTEVARQASDMILTDDNFSTIVSAIEEGRAVHGNIKRTIQYLLSTNTAELCIVFGTILFGMPNPFVPLSLLWINIVTDGLPSLALSVEPVRENFLEKSSGPSSKNFFDKKFLTEMVIVSCMMTAIALVVYQYALSVGSEVFAKSCVFNLLVYLTLFRSFSCRSDTETYFNLKFNPYHLLAVIVPITLQIILEFNEYFLKLLGIIGISLEQHLLLIGISIIPVVCIELYKGIFLMRHRPDAKS